LGTLRPAADVAAAVLATLTATTVWRGLTADDGWGFDDAERWIRACLERDLLGEPAPHRG
jgi:hypothetical protein